LAAARELQIKVQDLLDSALGPNRSVVQVSVAMDWTERETTSQSFDPDPEALRSSQLVQEAYTTTNGLAGGVPGADTNLPPADQGTVIGEEFTVYTRTESTINYELTQTETHEVAAPGKIDRVSLSVLVDDPSLQTTGGVADPEKLNTLKAVIGAAAGIDETRGDVLAVETLAFDRSYYEGQAAEMDKEQRTDQYIRIAQWSGAAILLAALLWYIQRLLSNLRLASAEAWMPILKPVSEVALPGAATPVPQFGDPALRSTGAAPGMAGPIPRLETPAIEASFELPGPSPEDEQTQRLIERLTEEDPASLAELIQLWLSDDEKQNG
jgi:flagellar M-ring protein FliF